jgi:hypothetical protein
LLPEVGLSFVVDVCVFQEDAELAVQAPFNVLAVFEEGAWLVDKLGAFFGGVDVLF